MTTPQPFMLPPPPVFRPKHPLPTESPSLTASFVEDKLYAASPLLHGSPGVSPMGTGEVDAVTTASTTTTTTTTTTTSTITPRKRRRRRSAADAAAAAATVKHQHSAIEKRRRVKINREFEALKFIVPACRATILQAHTDDPTASFDSQAIMHKLTILQSTVEYIQYLHLVIKLLKVQMLVPPQTRSFFKKWLHANNDLSFANYDLPIVEYRNLEQEYDFTKLYVELAANGNKIPQHWLDPVTKKIDFYTADSDSDDDCDGKNKIVATITATSESKLNSKSTSSSISPLTSPHPNIEQENRLYRHSILQLQNDDSSFKLPLPAIIDKYPTTTTTTTTTTTATATSADHASLLLDFKRSSSAKTSPTLPPLSRNPSISNMLN